MPSEILDPLWIQLTLNKNRRDLENNENARKNAKKAGEISDIMMENFLEDKENAPSRELLKGVLAHTFKELHPLEIIKLRAKAQGIPISASPLLKLPHGVILEIEKYKGLNTHKGLNTLGKAANQELLLQIREKIYPSTTAIDTSPDILPPATAIDTAPEVLPQEHHGTKQASHNTRRSLLDSLEERKE